MKKLFLHKKQARGPETSTVSPFHFAAWNGSPGHEREKGAKQNRGGKKEAEGMNAKMAKNSVE